MRIDLSVAGKPGNGAFPIALRREFQTLESRTENQIQNLKDSQGAMRNEIANLMLRAARLENVPKVEVKDEPLPAPVKRHFNWWQRFWQKFFLGFEVE